MPQLLALRSGSVKQQGARGAACARHRLSTEAVQTGHFHLFAEPLRASCHIEVPRRNTRQRTGAGWRRPRVCVSGSIGDQDFGGTNALEGSRHLVGCHFRKAQCTAREIEPREPHVDDHAAPVVSGAHGHQVDVALVGEQCRVGERPGSNHANHLALHRSFRGSWVADLFANGHGLAELHELREILLDSVMRHASHLDGDTGRSATLRQREIEQACGFFGVVVEELVEVTHPVEHECAGMLSLMRKYCCIIGVWAAKLCSGTVSTLVSVFIQSIAERRVRTFADIRSRLGRVLIVDRARTGTCSFGSTTILRAPSQGYRPAGQSVPH